MAKDLRVAGLYFLGMGLSINPLTLPLGVLSMVKGGKNIYDSYQGNYIQNSMMGVKYAKFKDRKNETRPNYIVEGLPSIKQFLEAYLTNNKMNFLMMQELNLFLQLDREDEFGNEIQYNAVTHAGNYKMLQELEKHGIIANLEKSYFKDKSLRFEKILLGDSKSKSNIDYRKRRINQLKENIKSQKGMVNKFRTLREELNIGIDKKTKMYKISFIKTNKEFSIEDISQILSFTKDENGILDRTKYDFVIDKNSNVKAIQYKPQYVFNMFKQRSKEILNKINERAKNKKSSVIDSLNKMTLSVDKVVENDINKSIKGSEIKINRNVDDKSII